MSAQPSTRAPSRARPNDHSSLCRVLRAPVRQVGKARYRQLGPEGEAAEPAVQLLAPSWAIVPLVGAPPPVLDPGIRTYSEHLAALSRLNRGGARYQLVPAYELNP